VDLERFTPERMMGKVAAREFLGIPRTALVIGFVGRLTRDKGIGDLLHAYEQLAGDDLRLLLVGPLEEGDALGSVELQAINIDERIHHIPWMDDPRIAYAAIDLLAFPSYREGMPNVTLEAQACGTPVVGYRATGTVDAVRDGHTGILVDVGDVNALIAALQKLIDDRELRNAMGARGHDWVHDSFAREVIWAELANRYTLWLQEAGQI
jgi:glycosyltransferase involved in cell wall biosynthesis